MEGYEWLGGSNCMILQTNSYIVPKDRRAEHARLLARFRQSLARLGCDHFEVYEQVGANWSNSETGRFVQIMRFRDRKHQQQVQAAERSDPGAQTLIKEFCDLINFPYQQQQGLFAVGFYSSVLAVGPTRVPGAAERTAVPPRMEDIVADAPVVPVVEQSTPTKQSAKKTSLVADPPPLPASGNGHPEVEEAFPFDDFPFPEDEEKSPDPSVHHS